MNKAYLTPPAVAALLGVQPAKVRRWIASGELSAANLAERASGRPRFRVSRQALDDFLASRTPSAPKPRKRRKRQERAMEYYG